MSYTLSCDASVKVGKESVRGLLHHTARDVDRLNGCEVKHRNQMIDGDRTGLNVTYVRDAAGGSWTRCTDIRQAQTALKIRLQDVTKTIRKDAVVLRELLLEMDPKWMEDHPDEAEREKSLEDMLDWCKDRFGVDNIVFYSIHKDETNWHIHVGVCPVSADGRLAQKDWFGSPAKLAAMHASFREHMQGRGYDIQKKEKTPGDPSRHLTDEEYKAFRDALAEQKAAVVAQAQVEADNIRDDARRDAEDIREAARQEAWNIKWKATQDGNAEFARATAEAQEAIDQERERLAADKQKAKVEAEDIRKQAQADAERVRKTAEAEARVTIATAWQEAQEAAVSLKVDMDVAASVLANIRSLETELTEQQRQRLVALETQRATMAARAKAALSVPDNQDQEDNEPSPS